MQGYHALGFALVCVGVLTAGCESTRGPTTSPTAQSTSAQAERLMRDRQYANAAHLYDDLAQHASSDARDSLLLRAAHAWIRAEDLPRGEVYLRQLGEKLATNDAPLKSLTLAEAALLDKRPERALSELDRIPVPYSRELAPEILEVRARAQFAYGRPTGGVTTALDRERLLNDPAEIARNRRMIWDGIQRSAAAGIDMQAPAGSSRAVAGWLDLGGAAVALARNPYAAQKAMEDWRVKYPEHPANEFLTQTVLPQVRADTTYPSDVALLLPLSGRTPVDGIAVQDGFIAALLQQPSEQRPVLHVYDTARMSPLDAYAKAIADGAKFVVGPLTKPEVATLVNGQQLSVPTLVLNELPDQSAAMSNLFRFWLDPTEEARQVAVRAVTEGHLHGIALVSNDDWGRRLHKAFDEELRARGGTLVAVQFYDPAGHTGSDPNAVDFSRPVSAALLIDESQARQSALQQVVGTKLQFEPRVRDDVDFVFLASRDPEKGRLLRPHLRSRLPEDFPVYTTSDIYQPAPSANKELDGIVFPDMPWNIAPDAISNQLRATLQKYWPTRAREKGRLYAFGFDAFRLIPRLQSADRNVNSATAGMTGRLELESSGRVRRDLPWARIVGGQPQLAPVTIATESHPVIDKP
jgi:outer membrane PBP1 activator LpoA protein